MVGFNLIGATAESDFVKSGINNVAKASGMYIKAAGDSVTASLNTTGYVENYGFFAF